MGGKLNSRKWAGECETVLGDRCGCWKSTAISTCWLCVEDGVLNHVIVSPYEIYEIPMEVNHEQNQKLLKLRSGPKGQTGSYATLNIMTQAIYGSVGGRSAGGGDLIDEEQWRDRHPRSHIWIFEGQSIYS